MIFNGKKYTWEEDKYLSGGDAGEVYLVHNQLTREKAVLKRPGANDIARQAFQIQNEGETLLCWLLGSSV